MKPSVLVSLLFSLLVLIPAAISQTSDDEKDWASVQIVNATCVPEIALYIDKKPVYPNFPQGLYTGDAPLPYTQATYQAADTSKKLASPSADIKFASKAKQTLLITGDFSKTHPPDNLPQPEVAGDVPLEPNKEFAPNVQFRLLSHSLAEGEKPVRYRFFNAIPKMVLNLKIKDAPSGHTLAPGETVSLSEQKPSEYYLANVGEENLEVFMNQEGQLRNCTIVFFLKDGKPAFMRSFENLPDDQIIEE